jgi:hypothetical protein
MVEGRDIGGAIRGRGKERTRSWRMPVYTLSFPTVEFTMVVELIRTLVSYGLERRPTADSPQSNRAKVHSTSDAVVGTTKC